MGEIIPTLSEEIKIELEKAKAFEPIAQVIAKTLSSKDNAINKISNATRGNGASENDSNKIHRLQIAIGEETAKRYRDSMNRYVK